MRQFLVFLFDSKKIKALDKDELKRYCINLEKFLRFNEYSDIDGLNLFFRIESTKRNVKRRN